MKMYVSGFSEAGVRVHVRTERSFRNTLGASLDVQCGMVAGAEVEVNGAWTILDSPLLEADVPLDPLGPTFQVDRFQVLVVGGRAAIDGLLGEDNGAYYLELLAGNRIWLNSAPSDFKSCLGKRVWVTGSVDDPPFMIGVID